MARLPVPGSDDGTWGDVLNDFLAVEHNTNGTLKTSGSLSTKADAADVTKLNGVAVYVEDYGAKGDGTTDDSAAITSAIAAAVSAAQSDGSYYAEVRFQAKTYLVNTPTTGGSTNGSAMIPLPVLPVAGQKMTLALKGIGDASGLYHWYRFKNHS